MAGDGQGREGHEHQGYGRQCEYPGSDWVSLPSGAPVSGTVSEFVLIMKGLGEESVKPRSESALIGAAGVTAQPVLPRFPGGTAPAQT